MTFFSDRLLLTVVLWVVIYASDYVLTRISAGWYQAGVKQHILYQGGIELTPIYKRDISRLRWISPRFLFLLAFTSVAIYMFGVLAIEIGIPWLVDVLVGAWFLVEAAIHMRHLRNLAMFYYLKDSRGVQGSIQYEMWLSYRVSAMDGLTFALLYGVIYLLTGSPFFLGGVLTCAGLGLFHWLLSFREQRRKSQKAAEGSSL